MKKNDLWYDVLFKLRAMDCTNYMVKEYAMNKLGIDANGMWSNQLTRT